MFDYISTIINSVIALLGVVLGWFLSEWSKRGKLEILNNCVGIILLSQNDSGGFIEVEKAFDADMISLSARLEFYNVSSSNKKVIRDLKLQVDPKKCSKGNDLIILDDCRVESFSINPQELKKLTISQAISKDIYNQLEDAEVYLTYKNVNGKSTIFLLNKPNHQFLKTSEK